MKTSNDPTGQAKNRKRGTKALQIRLSLSEREVLGMFRAIPRTRTRVTKITNAESLDVYQYEWSAAESLAFAANVQGILNRRLLEVGSFASADALPPPSWYWRTIIERSYNQGTANSIVTFNQLINKHAPRLPPTGFPIGQIDVQDVLLSVEQERALASVLADNTNKIVTLSQTTASQVMQRVNAGISAGETPTAIKEMIQDRFNVSRSNAARIARTEINKAYTSAEMDFTDLAAKQTGLRAGVIHVSALVMTTRRNHAARHGNAYTTAQQRQWWDSGTERINCLCSTISVLIDKNGKTVDSQQQKEIQSEKSFFDEPLKPTPTPTPAPRPKPKPAPKPKLKPKPKPKPKPAPAPVPKPPIIREKPEKAAEAIPVIQEIKTAKPKPKSNPKKIKKTEKPVIVDTENKAAFDGPPRIQTGVKLTGDQSAYVEYYKGDGFYKNNEILRNRSKYSADEVNQAEKMRDHIDSAIKRSKVEADGFVYRGIKDKSVFDGAEKLIGKDIALKTAQSTSTTASVGTTWSGLIRTKDGSFFTADKGESVVMKIKLKKGQSALNMESLSMGATGEKEVLLASTGKYNVTGVKLLKDNEGNVTGKVVEVDYNE